MNTTTQEALAKVASISEALESFAKNIAAQRINIFPIEMSDDFYAMEDTDEEKENRPCSDCLGCMDCLGLSWNDFL